MFCAKFLDKTASVQKNHSALIFFAFLKNPMTKRIYNKRLTPNNLPNLIQVLITKSFHGKQTFKVNQLSFVCVEIIFARLLVCNGRRNFLYIFEKISLLQNEKNFESLAPNSLFFLFCTSSIWKKTKTTTIRMHSECHNRLINLVRDLGDYIVYSSLRHWPTSRHIAIPIRKEVALA